jgi:hypothetical protein
MKLKKLIKKINKENAPPGGWKKGDKLTSSQAAGRRNQGHKPRVQASSLSLQAPGSGNPDKVGRAQASGNRQQGQRYFFYV